MIGNGNNSDRVRIPCRICESVEFTPRFRKNDFSIEQCLQCGLTQVTDPPKSADLSSYYDQGFFDTFYDTLQSDPARRRYEYRKFDCRLTDIEKWAKQKGRILDVGCSFGFFLDAARRRGWEVFGLEISDFAANYAREKLGIPVVNEPLGDSVYEAERFDTVTMWNVIEHLEDPASTLRQVHRILKTEGILVLTTANVDSLLARLQGTRWRMLIPPIHLMHFSPSTISRLLRSCGLEPIEQTCALPYEFVLKRLKLLGVVRRMHLSDKMLVCARKVSCQVSPLSA